MRNRPHCLLLHAYPLALDLLRGQPPSRPSRARSQARRHETPPRHGSRALGRPPRAGSPRGPRPRAHATAARGAGSGGLFERATALVGNTPVVKISDKLAPPGVEVYAKCEFNPLASVKDRLAVAIIEDAEIPGEL